MGEAKRRAKERERQEEQLRGVNMSSLAGAVRHVASVVTKYPGRDCYLHATIGKRLLERLGVKSNLVVGFAGWRVGEGVSDVILCLPVTREIFLNEGFPCHAWIEIGHYILDLATYQFSMQAAMFEELDGVSVSWYPDFLFAKKESVSSMRDLISKDTWRYYYERNLQLEQEMSKYEVVTDDYVDMALAFYHAAVADNYLSLKAA